jgi:hypothetical protein
VGDRGTSATALPQGGPTGKGVWVRLGHRWCSQAGEESPSIYIIIL